MPGPHTVSLYSKELNGVIVGVDLKTTHLELLFFPTLNDMTQVHRQGVPPQPWSADQLVIYLSNVSGPRHLPAVQEFFVGTNMLKP